MSSRVKTLLTGCKGAPGTARTLGILMLLLCIGELLLLYFSFAYKVPNFNVYATIDASNLDSQEVRTEFGFDSAYQKRFLSELRKVAPLDPQVFTIEEAIKVREAIRNLGHIGEIRASGTPIDLLEGIRENRRLLRGELAFLYGYTLDSLGFKVRNMRVARSVFDPWDSHSIIEVWDESRGRWVLSDPTFNVSFLKSGEYLSTVQLYEAIHSGKLSEVAVQKSGDPSYSYSFENYYISYFSLFDNLYYVSHLHVPGIGRFPPLRFLDQRRFVRLVITEKYAPYTGEIAIQNLALFALYLVIPLLIMTLAISSVLACRGRKP